MENGRERGAEKPVGRSLTPAVKQTNVVFSFYHAYYVTQAPKKGCIVAARMIIMGEDRSEKRRVSP